ncbi:MAG: hypothetical protein JSS32_00525 [Verrucomicrobia bacterium]|nr:hypothetical protein [Verrucomicrobiota bacterium]
MISSLWHVTTSTFSFLSQAKDIKEIYETYQKISKDCEESNSFYCDFASKTISSLISNPGTALAAAVIGISISGLAYYHFVRIRPNRETDENQELNRKIASYIRVTDEANESIDHSIERMTGLSRKLKNFNTKR